MEEIASQQKINFIINTGDNFEDQNEQSWDSNWKNVYHKLPNLAPLIWHGVVGNRDYNYNWLDVEYFSNREKWKLPNYFWSHKQTFGN